MRRPSYRPGASTARLRGKRPHLEAYRPCPNPPSSGRLDESQVRSKFCAGFLFYLVSLFRDRDSRRAGAGRRSDRDSDRSVRRGPFNCAVPMRSATRIADRRGARVEHVGELLRPTIRAMRWTPPLTAACLAFVRVVGGETFGRTVALADLFDHRDLVRRCRSGVGLGQQEGAGSSVQAHVQVVLDGVDGCGVHQLEHGRTRLAGDCDDGFSGCAE